MDIPKGDLKTIQRSLIESNRMYTEYLGEFKGFSEDDMAGQVTVAIDNNMRALSIIEKMIGEK